MPRTQNEIRELVASPRESLTVEIKDWVDPASPEGQAKIVKACLALRNHNGGVFLVGFENATWTPNLAAAPADVRSEWDADDIQILVSRFASVTFEVHLHFGELKGQEFPVLEVDSGVRSPVASKSEIPDPLDSRRKLVRRHAVYVRSLSSNGSVSTTEARYDDWPDLMRRCFDNFEADIGRFARRHLGGITPAAARSLAEALSSLITPTSSEPLPEIEVENFMRYGFDRFETELRERNLTPLPRHGFWQVSVIVQGDIPGGRAMQEFLNLISASNPTYTGWPAWIDSSGFANVEGELDPGPRPYIHDGGWEAFVYSRRGGQLPDRIDFWRAEPVGRFYLYRALQDDLATIPSAPEPMAALDPGLVITRTAEAIAVPMAFAREMGATPEETILHYAFRWSGLGGREISAWAFPEMFVSPGYVCHQDDVNSQVAVSLDTPTSALGRFVRGATTPLFSAFSGWMPDPSVTEDLADRFLSRNL